MSQMTMNMLAQAQGVCATTAGQDEDMVDYINGLRESVLEAYSGITQASLETNHFFFRSCSPLCFVGALFDSFVVLNEAR